MFEPGKNNRDYIAYAGIVNRECEKFKLDELTSNMFKCLISTQGLIAEKDAAVRTRIFAKLEQNQTVTVQQVSEDIKIAPK